MNPVADTWTLANAGHLALEALLIAAAAIDWRTHRLPNWLTLGGTAAGLVLSMLPAGIGFFDSVLGVLTALALLVPLYAMHVTGAGDAKLVAMVGAFLGLPDLLFALVFIVIAGGACAIGYAAWHHRLLRLAENARDMTQLAAMAALHGQRPQLPGVASIGKLPYGVCVCAGTLAWLAWAHLHT